MSKIFHLLYVSKASSLYERDVDLVQLLDTSRTFNSKKGITGILITNHKFFIQLLEGREDIIKKLYAKIELDRRHHGSKVLLEFESDRRMFPQWSMGAKEDEGLHINYDLLVALIHEGSSLDIGYKERCKKILQNFNTL